MKALRHHSAFTLLELLVVLAMTTLLVCTLAPVLARTNQDANAIQCVNNFRQMMNAWKIYSDDYQGWLVANRGSAAVPWNWVKGFLDYSSGADNTNINNLIGPNALLGPYIRSASYFKCPADKSTVNIGGGRKPRVRSISMNAYVGEGSQGWDTSYRRYEKAIDIVSPTPDRLWVLIDEHEDSINDGGFYTSPTTSPTSDQLIDFPAARHNRGCTISFADGRVEIHEWRDARTMPIPKYSTIPAIIVAPNNVDVDWLNERSSSRP